MNRIKRLAVLMCLLMLPALAWGEAPAELRAPKHGDVYVVAHRGAHQGIPENTLAAYQKAIELGVDFVEVDLRTTKDGHIVSVHNATMEAYAPGVPGKVADLTLAQLKALDIGSRIGPAWKAERVPTFDEILALCKGKVGIYIDLKQADVAQVLALLRAHAMARDALWYAGPRDLERAAKACPECWIMPDPGPERFVAPTLDRFKPKVIAPVWRHYSKTYVEQCHAAGALVIVDESDPDCWENAVAWGSDGVQTDHPEAFIAFLEARKKAD